jgi:energy-coupling factor transporter ATP-binding protein EcfA2
MPQSPLQIGAALKALSARQPPLIGRDHELATLRASIEAGRSVFVTGPSGIGKTALLDVAYAAANASQAGLPVFYCGESSTRRGIVTHMLVNLFLYRGRLQSEYLNRRNSVDSLAALRRFATQERLPDLKRMMHQNLGRGGACLLLDHLDDPDSRVAALIEVWLETMPLVIVARTAERVGRVRWLLSSFEHLEVPPLRESMLLRLAQNHVACARGLRSQEATIREAVDRAAGNPGRLLQLMQVAGRPEYHRNGAVQWRLIDLDLRIGAIGLGDRARGKAGAV